MAKKQLRTQPPWDMPTDEELAQSLPGKAVKHFEDYHEGLAKIECEAVWMNDAGAKVPSSIFQSFELDGGGRGRVPGFNAMTLARIVWLRCDRFAAKKKRKVNFVVQLLGSEADGKSWTHRVRFTLDGTPDDLTDEDQEEDEDDDEEELDEEELDHGNRRLSDHARQMGDTSGGFVRARPLQLPPGPHVGQGEIDVMQPAMLNHGGGQVEHGMNGQAQVLRAPGSGDSAMLVRALQGAYGGALAEHRAFVEQLRLDRSSDRNESKEFVRQILEENRRGNKQVVDALLDRLNAAESRAEKAEGRIIEMSKLESGEREFNMQVAQQGWVSFIEGMRMKAESVSLQQEYDRAFLGLQLQGAKSTNNKSAAGSALKNLLPFAATGLSAILRARGDENSAHTIDELSKMVTRATIGAAAAEGAQAQGQAAQQQHQASGAMPPIIAAIRNLYDSLRPDQSEHLKTIMPGPAWSLLEGAAKTDIEAACIACLTSMNAFMRSDPSISLRVLGALDEPKQQQLTAIVQAIQGVPQPTPAAAPAAASPRPNGAPKRMPVFASAKPGAAPPRRMPPRPGSASPEGAPPAPESPPS